MKSFAGLAVLAAAALLVAPVIGGAVGSGQAVAGNFGSLKGSWRGGGQINLAGGRSESLRCKAYYNPKAGGQQLGMAVRCASTSYKFELRAQLAVKDGRVTGSWEERTFNASGSAAGVLQPGRMSLSASGAVNAGITVSFSDSRQSVVMSGNFDKFRGIKLALSR